MQSQFCNANLIDKKWFHFVNLKITLTSRIISHVYYIWSSNSLSLELFLLFFPLGLLKYHSCFVFFFLLYNIGGFGLVCLVLNTPGIIFMYGMVKTILLLKCIRVFFLLENSHGRHFRKITHMQNQHRKHKSPRQNHRYIQYCHNSTILYILTFSARNCLSSGRRAYTNARWLLSEII